MRIAVSLLVCLAAITFGSAQVTVKEVVAGDTTKSPIDLRNSGIVGTESILRVTVDGDATRRKWVEKYGASQLGEVLNQVQKLDAAAAQGVAALDKVRVAIEGYSVSAPNPDPAVQEQARKAYAKAVQQVAVPALQIFQRRTEDPKLSALLLEETQGKQKVAYYLAIYTAAGKRATELRAEAAEAMATSNVQISATLGLFRELSPSRERNVVPFSPISDSQAQYAASLDTRTNELAEALKNFRKNLAEKGPTAAKQLAEAVKKSVKALTDTAVDEAKKLEEAHVAGIGVPLQHVQTEAKNLAQLGESIQQFIEGFEIQSQDPMAILTELNQKVGALQQLIQSGQSSVANVRQAIADIRTFLLTSSNSAIAASVTRLETTVDTEATKLKEGLSDALAQLGGLGSALETLTKMDTDFHQIGVQTQSKALGNDKQIIIDLVPSVTNNGVRTDFGPGDRLPIRVVAREGTNEIELYRRTLVSYPDRYFQDRIVFLSLTPSEDKRSLRPSAAYAWVYKKGSMSSLYANEMGAVGVGLAVLALDQNRDDALEVGIAPVISVINDYLQLGYGLNTTRNRGFWFFGARLPFKL